MWLGVDAEELCIYLLLIVIQLFNLGDREIEPHVYILVRLQKARAILVRVYPQVQLHFPDWPSWRPENKLCFSPMNFAHHSLWIVALAIKYILQYSEEIKSPTLSLYQEVNTCHWVHISNSLDRVRQLQ